LLVFTPQRLVVELLRATMPASLVLFDVLQLGVDNLVGMPFAERRRWLELAAADATAPLPDELGRSFSAGLAGETERLTLIRRVRDLAAFGDRAEA
jgi:ATP-dependent DNA ligase